MYQTSEQGEYEAEKTLKNAENTSTFGWQVYTRSTSVFFNAFSGSYSPE